jgi:hypothetical protein
MARDLDDAALARHYPAVYDFYRSAVASHPGPYLDARVDRLLEPKADSNPPRR